MSCVQARRTLVKSPPELWAELSDVEALNRRLEPFGEIRITRLEPESTVAWEGERARGTVEIEPSGWGTRVTLTAEASAPDADHDEPRREDEEPQLAATEPQGAEPVQLDPPHPTPAPDTALPQTIAALGQALPLDIGFSSPVRPQPAPRPGWWSRIFRRPAGRDGLVEESLSAPVATRTEHASTPPPSPLSEPTPAPEPLPPPVEPPAVPPPPPAPDPEPEPEPPLEPAAQEQSEAAVLAEEDLDGVLTGVLDALGAAHHRPFSRG